MVTLLPIDFLQGIMALLFCINGLIIGISILLKYREYKSIVYVYIGIAWLGLAFPWLPDAISFLMILLINTQLNLYVYFIIGNAFLPLFLFLWVAAVCDFIYKEKKKLILTIYGVLSILFEIVFFFLLITDINQIGQLVPGRAFTVDFAIIVILLLIVIIISFLAFGVQFGRQSLKSSEPEVKLKGKLIIVALVIFSVAAMLDSVIGALGLDPTDPTLGILFIATRASLMVSGILFYGGFFLPSVMKKLFLRE
jgi:hypothetical protein